LNPHRSHFKNPANAVIGNGILKGIKDLQKSVVFLLTTLMFSLIVLPAFSGDIRKAPMIGKPKVKPGMIKRCDDGLSCTEDRIINGQCSHVVKPGFCLIDDVCYSRHQKNAKNTCQECRDDWGTVYQTRWGFENSNACSDGNTCTQDDHCSSGNCVGTLKPNCE
jgi:hypothetical protein